MTVRAFIVLLLVTVVAIWFGDSIAQEYAAPGLERTVGILAAIARGLAIGYSVGTGESLIFADRSFDIVVSVDVLEHVADLDRVIAEGNDYAAYFGLKTRFDYPEGFDVAAERARGDLAGLLARYPDNPALLEAEGDLEKVAAWTRDGGWPSAEQREQLFLGSAAPQHGAWGVERRRR